MFLNEYEDICMEVIVQRKLETYEVWYTYLFTTHGIEVEDPSGICRDTREGFRT